MRYFHRATVGSHDYGWREIDRASYEAIERQQAAKPPEFWQDGTQQLVAVEADEAPTTPREDAKP